MYRLIYKPLAYYEYQVQKKVFFNLFWRTVYKSWYCTSAQKVFDALVISTKDIKVLVEHP